MIEWTGSVTAGSLSDPRFRDNNAGRQLAGRAVDAADRGHGVWRVGIARRVARRDARNRSRRHRSRAARSRRIWRRRGFSAGPFLVRGEAIRAEWQMPQFGTLNLSEPLIAISSLIEGRYKIKPGLYVAMRGDRLDFSKVRGTVGPVEWEAQTWRSKPVSAIR
jgi:hypothetical protein